MLGEVVDIEGVGGLRHVFSRFDEGKVFFCVMMGSGGWGFGFLFTFIFVMVAHNDGGGGRSWWSVVNAVFYFGSWYLLWTSLVAFYHQVT